MNNKSINNVFSVAVYNFFPTFNKLFNASTVKITWFRLEEIVQPSLQFHVIIERNATQCIREGSEQMEIRSYQVGRIRRMWQHFPAKRLNGFLGHIGDVRAGVVVLQKNGMSPIRSFLLDSVVESLHLLDVKFRIHCLVPIKQFVVDHAFPVPPYAQHRFARVKILFCSRCRPFVGAKPFFALLHIDVQAPFFVAGNNSVEESLLVSMSWPMTGKQTGWIMAHFDFGCNFWTFPIEWRWRSMVLWEHSIISTNSLVVWRGSSWISWFSRSSSNWTCVRCDACLWGRNCRLSIA